MPLLRRSPKPAPPLPAVQPPGSVWWWLIPGLIAIGAAAWATLGWLLNSIYQHLPPTEVTARIEAARTALGAAAGVGAGVTLLLAVRRQRHQELATAHATHDATERRVTELYTKAVEQLGHDQAPVRLGGLYALERLAQDTPALRQTIADVICAYLRMPYTPSHELDRREKIRAAQRARNRRPLNSAGPGGRNRSEEREVRLTAQRILTAHLRHMTPPERRWWQPRPADLNDRHWPGIRLDLTDATLIDFGLGDCRVGEVRFDGASFTGVADFENVVFAGAAHFSMATFTSDAAFEGATFTGVADFEEVTFTGSARFEAATFAGDAWFNGATFSGSAWFGHATFSDEARFAGATFMDDADFARAAFGSLAVFGGVTFRAEARFDGAIFNGSTQFDEEAFTSRTGASLAGEAAFDGELGKHCTESR